MTLKHLLSSDDLNPAEQAAIVRRGAELKKLGRDHPRSLEGRSVGMIFEKPSTRTRVSFEVAVSELGGHAVILRSDELQLGRGETVQDTARVLSRYLDAVVVRTSGHDRLAGLAEAAAIPVVNALSDREHPCQALGDVMTIGERFADLAEVELVFVGDGNNVCHSLLLAGAKAGFARVEAVCPPGYEPDESVLERARAIGAGTGTRVAVSDDPVAACRGATVLYTDVWASMGQEREAEERRLIFAPYQLNALLLADAADDAIVLHCLPAHRGEEISDDVIDGPHSVVWQQAENRLHTQKALLEWLVGR